MKSTTLTVVAAVAIAGAGDLSAGTVAHWQFDEGTGQYAGSAGDAANTYQLIRGTSTSAYADPAWVTPGRDGAGAALQFVNEKLTGTESGRDFLLPSPAADVSGLVLPSFTVEAWVKLSSLPAAGFDANNPYTIVELVEDNAGTKVNYHLRVEQGTTGGRLTGFYYDAGGTLRLLSHPTELSAGQWHHVAFGRDSANDLSKLWVDGVEHVSIQTNDPVTSLSAPKFAVGGSHRDNPDRRERSFDGLIDDVRISDTLLTTDQLLVPEPGGAALLGAAALLALRRGSRVRRGSHGSRGR